MFFEVLGLDTLILTFEDSSGNIISHINIWTKLASAIIGGGVMVRCYVVHSYLLLGHA